MACARDPNSRDRDRDVQPRDRDRYDIDVISVSGRRQLVVVSANMAANDGDRKSEARSGNRTRRVAANTDHTDVTVSDVSRGSR